MIQVTVKNLQNEVVASAKFATLELAEAYVAEQTASQSVCLWGTLAHVESVPTGEVDEMGLPVVELVEHAQDFTVEYADLGDVEAWDAIRAERNRLLAECDYTQLVDSPLSTEIKAQYVTYRQLLRDITNAISPEEVIWPIKP